ncbi:MAG: nitroreductase family protein [Candidatus Peribacteraceae bacterium]
MDFAGLLALMQKRRSTRSFTKTPIDKDTIEEMIQAAVLAPSVENTQPWRFHVVTNKELMHELMNISCYGNFESEVGTFIVVTCDRSAQAAVDLGPIWNPKEMEYSCAGAMYGLMLAAAAKGLSSCWVSLHHGPAHNILKLKDHQIVIGAVMIGHATQEDGMPHDRKATSSVIEWHA